MNKEQAQNEIDKMLKVEGWEWSFVAGKCYWFAHLKTENGVFSGIANLDSKNTEPDIFLKFHAMFHCVEYMDYQEHLLCLQESRAEYGRER